MKKLTVVFALMTLPFLLGMGFRPGLWSPTVSTPTAKVGGVLTTHVNVGDTVRLDVVATAFQRRVWQALRRIPYGETRSYAEVARSLGRPRAARAVARACAANPTALVVPCQRVVASDGTAGGYRWGVERKRALLARESSRAAASATRR